MVGRNAVWQCVQVGLVAFATSCGGSTEQEITSPSPARCQMALTVPELPYTAGQHPLSLVTTRDCTWQLGVEVDWISVEPTTGQGESVLTLTARQNPTGRRRLSRLLVNQQAFEVAQQAAPCAYAVAPGEVDIDHRGGRVLLTVSTLDGCSWTTMSSDPWLRVAAGSGGDASGRVELTVDSNPGAERSALLTLATITVAVTQAAAPDDRSACRYSLHPGAASFSPAGGQGSLRLSTGSGCAWGAVSSQPWLIVISSGNGVGSDDIRYRVDPNPGASARSAAISAGTRRHVVRQEGAR